MRIDPFSEPALARGFSHRRAAWISLVVAVLCAASAVATLAAEEPPPPKTEEPDESSSDDDAGFDHQVEVSGGSAGQVTFTPVGVASDVVRPAEEPGSPRALTAAIEQVPAVSQNGQGGLFQVFSIRGLSRQRVATFLGGIRITSERRAGASASFLDPTLMDEIRVLRGPATTFYGSGAMGGVVEIGARGYDGWSFAGGYETNGDQRWVTGGGGGDHWSVGLARREADDARAANGTRIHSGFTQTSAVVKGNWKSGPLGYDVLFVPSLGQDIGKANSDYPVRTTDYPLERHGLFRFRVTSEKQWTLQAVVHAQDLETTVVEQDTETRSEVENQSVDFALDWHGNRQVGKRFTVTYGADAFGRRAVSSNEEVEDLSAPGDPPLTFDSLDDARSTELGLSGSAQWNGEQTVWELGARFSRIDQSNAGVDEVDRTAWSGHAGIAHTLGDHIEIRGNLGTGIRFPTLTELYYSGTTGRGQVVGNPQLEPERAISLEGSLRWTSQKILLTGGVFGTRVLDYIERVELSPDVLTFRNIRSGTILGLELQGVARLGTRLRLSLGGHLIEGEDEDGMPLSDIPPAELWVGADYGLGKWSFAGTLTHRAALDDPGPGEMSIPSAELLGLAVDYRFGDLWSARLNGTNLLDELWFASADDRATFAPGRSVMIQIVRSLR